MMKSASRKKKRSAPQKICPECGLSVHARVSFCGGCNYIFYVKKKIQQVALAKNWRDLQSGDIVKCITGSGPYFISRDRPGERIMLGQKGKFEVVSITDQGPRSCGIIGKQISSRGQRSNVVEYIYMGESYYDDDLSTHKEPHKIKVIKNTKTVDKHDTT